MGTEKKEILLPCTCSCSILKVTKWSDEDEYYFQSYSSFNISKSFTARIKEAWTVLVGKSNENYGIIVSSEDFKNFQKWN